MTTLKIFLPALFLSLLLFHPVNSKADGVAGNKSSELNSQIIEEIKEILQTPYLKFESKDLNGEVNLICKITKEGKIIFTDLTGVNENLVANVISKLNSLNLWTSPDYSKNEFNYRIKYTN
jgi:hypothetical protein